MCEKAGASARTSSTVDDGRRFNKQERWRRAASLEVNLLDRWNQGHLTNLLPDITDLLPRASESK
jgi:hypothetical protein